MAATYSQKFSLFKNEIKQALEDEDDVLAAYTRFVEWLAGYEQDQTRESSADSPRDDGDLLIVLEEAIRRLKEDPLCLSDRRYLKLWIMFAKRVDIPEYVYAYMFANKIGTMYSPIYEEYAKVLEMESKCVLRLLQSLHGYQYSLQVEGSEWCLSGRHRQSRARYRQIEEVLRRIPGTRIKWKDFEGTIKKYSGNISTSQVIRLPDVISDVCS